MPCAFIDDGYTETARMAAAPGVSPAITFRFRPVTAGEFGEYAHKLELSNTAEAKVATAEILASKLVDWDVRDASGVKIEITVDNLLRLEHELHLKLFQVVIGEIPGDDSNVEHARSNAEADAKN